MPRILDTFSGGGGAGCGYHLAGFEVVGVDIQPQPNYPFEFIQADALDVLRDREFLAGFDAIHASPPCQAYTPLNHYNHRAYPDLVDETRELLEASGLPYVIENVPQAPLRDPVILCGTMFGLRMYRHRGFETNFPLPSPVHRAHTARCARNGYLPTPERPFMSIHGGRHSRAWLAAAKEVMGMPWVTTIREVCEAIPPAYTEYIGRHLIAAVSTRTEAA